MGFVVNGSEQFSTGRFDFPDVEGVGFVFTMVHNDAFFSYFGQQTDTLRSNLLRGLYRPLRHPENNRSRLFAPTILEQQAAIKRQSTVVQIRLPTKELVNVEIDAVTTSDEIVDRCLRMKGLVDVEGCGLNVETADFNGVISNGNFIFDGLSQFEASINENDYLVKFKTFFKSNDDQSSSEFFKQKAEKDLEQECAKDKVEFFKALFRLSGSSILE